MLVKAASPMVCTPCGAHIVSGDIYNKNDYQNLCRSCSWWRADALVSYSERPWFNAYWDAARRALGCS